MFTSHVALQSVSQLAGVWCVDDCCLCRFAGEACWEDGHQTSEGLREKSNACCCSAAFPFKRIETSNTTSILSTLANLVVHAHYFTLAVGIPDDVPKCTKFKTSLDLKAVGSWEWERFWMILSIASGIFRILPAFGASNQTCGEIFDIGKGSGSLSNAATPPAQVKEHLGSRYPARDLKYWDLSGYTWKYNIAMENHLYIYIYTLNWATNHRLCRYSLKTLANPRFAEILHISTAWCIDWTASLQEIPAVAPHFMRSWGDWFARNVVSRHCIMCNKLSRLVLITAPRQAGMWLRAVAVSLALDLLRLQFSIRRVEKIYLALCHGHVPWFKMIQTLYNEVFSPTNPKSSSKALVDWSNVMPMSPDDNPSWCC